jgi:hypothetical protein
VGEEVDMQPGTPPGLRASDADRGRVVEALARHTAAGRLTLDEYSERVALAHTAVTVADLAAITRDLPAGYPQPAVTRQLVVAFLVALAALGVLLGALAVLR